jgi:Holliday junction resolvasome RuvABC ATP-dependent DNA helicase subunit
METGAIIVAVGAAIALWFGLRRFRFVSAIRKAQAQELDRRRDEARQRENNLTREIEAEAQRQRQKEQSRARVEVLRNALMLDSLPATGLADVVGQKDLKKRVSDRLRVARSRGWPFPHTLISGAEGMGRLFIATAIAIEISSQEKIIAIPGASSILDISGALSTLPPGGCAVLRNIDSIDSEIVGKLQAPLERGQLEIQLGLGPAARTHFMPLQEFSVIATCTNAAKLPAAVLSHFTVEVLEPYSNAELAAIASLNAVALGFGLDQGAAACVASNADGTPGCTATLLQRVRRYAGTSTLNESGLLSILNLLGVSKKAVETGSGLLEDLRSMSGIEFEEWTATLLRKHGYQVKSTAVVGDHGIDLEIERAGRKIVVQCKRWSDTVGEPELREFYGSMLHSRADAGIFVTTSSFSTQAREFVQQKPITLLDLKSLVDLFLYGGAVETLVPERLGT